ncbi:MAG: hypothetical protein U9R75_11190 [Candidatus Thermoplasmatota archaeon]|nr:hypothetical protein [Candidatus Thermoplasmatota archaeon]
MDPAYVSRLITDEYVMKILVSTLKRPLSAQQLALKYDIPIAVCYRKMKDLLAADLIQKDEKTLTSRGKWVQLYRSKLKGAYVFLEKGELRVRLELADIENPEMDRSVKVIQTEY